MRHFHFRAMEVPQLELVTQGVLEPARIVALMFALAFLKCSKQTLLGAKIPQKYELKIIIIIIIDAVFCCEFVQRYLVMEESRKTVFPR